MRRMCFSWFFPSSCPGGGFENCLLYLVHAHVECLSSYKESILFFFFLQEFYFGRTLDLLKYIVNTALLGALLVKLLEFIAT